jgi:hypothetical protein
VFLGSGICSILTEFLADIDERVDNIKTIGDVNKELLNITVNNLSSILRDLEATNRNRQIIAKVSRQIKMYDSVSSIVGVNNKLPILYEQMIVLMIGALEVYIADIFRTISNRNPEYLVWRSEKEKVSFDPALLSEGFTLGDVITGHLKTQGFSFQDLRSTLEAFQKYFDITIDLDKEMKDTLILAAACRNIIVHNRSEIDSAFRKQIRLTSHAVEKRYKKGNKLSVDEAYVDMLGKMIKSFCRHITILLMQRDET